MGNAAEARRIRRMTVDEERFYALGRAFASCCQTLRPWESGVELANRVHELAERITPSLVVPERPPLPRWLRWLTPDR